MNSSTLKTLSASSGALAALCIVGYVILTGLGKDASALVPLATGFGAGAGGLAINPAPKA